VQLHLVSYLVSKVPGNESSMVRKFQRTKVPENESSTYGTFAPGSESTWERKFQLPYNMYLLLLYFYILTETGTGRHVITDAVWELGMVIKTEYTRFSHPSQSNNRRCPEFPIHC